MIEINIEYFYNKMMNLVDYLNLIIYHLDLNNLNAWFHNIYNHKLHLNLVDNYLKKSKYHKMILDHQ